MRAFQLKAQRNITIVDLDDDNEESECKADKDKESEEANGKTIPTENSKDTDNAEAMPVDTTTDDTAKEDAIKKPSQVPFSKTDKLDDIETNETEKSNHRIDQPDDNSSKNENDNVVNVKLPDPTLFELLNWLDNPPEDITFVSEFCITLDDFCEAVKVVQPSAKREGFITVPDVTWDDIGSLQDIREELKLAVLAPVKFPEKLARLGLSAPSGVLLCGPPGCGKTLLAKAVANEAGINFISVKGPELMNMVIYFI